MISSMLEPASRFSKTVATGIRVPRNTHAPLRLSATLSTAGHWDQSRVAMLLPPLIVAFYHSWPTSCAGQDDGVRHVLQRLRLGTAGRALFTQAGNDLVAGDRLYSAALQVVIA